MKHVTLGDVDGDKNYGRTRIHRLDAEISRHTFEEILEAGEASLAEVLQDQGYDGTASLLERQLGGPKLRPVITGAIIQFRYLVGSLRNQNRRKTAAMPDDHLMVGVIHGGPFVNVGGHVEAYAE